MTVTDCSIYDGWWGLTSLASPEEEKKENVKILSGLDIQKLKNIPKGISIVPLKDSVIPEEALNCVDLFRF